MEIIKASRKSFKQAIENLSGLSVDELLNPKKPYWIFISFVVLSTMALTKEIYSKRTLGHPKISEAKTDITTFIPAGFTLVPITLVNQESFDSLVDDFGVVDLFSSDQNDERKSKNLARNLRIIRAPLNREQFAVLVPEANSSLIQTLTLPVFGVIKNRDATTSQSAELKMKALPHVNITYGDNL